MKTPFVLCFLLFFVGCKTTTLNIDGPKATQLSGEKDKQISGLVSQVKSEQVAREMAEKQASLAAANLDGVLFAAEHVSPGLPRNAIEEEAKLGKARLPASDPAEINKAKDRVIAILQNEIEKTKTLYGAAFNEASLAKAAIAEKDAEIVKRNKEINDRQVLMVKLTEEKAAEQVAAIQATEKKDLDHKAEIKKLKDAYAAKERATWILWARIASLGLVVAGAVAIAVFKLAGAGGGLVGAGVLVGLISLGIEALTATWWFVYLCAGVFLIIVGLGIYAIYRMWVKNALANKKTQAIQDMLDEATIRGDSKTVDELKAHLSYRLGDKTTFFGKEQAKEVVELGLVNLKGEEILKKGVDKASKTG